MIIKCFRCGKDIDTPNAFNADYIAAQDTIVEEPREVLLALKHNQATLIKKAKMAELDENGNPKYPNLVIADGEYNQEEVPNIKAAKDFVKVIPEVRNKNIQKTGVICPDCYRPTDTLIWGVHKEKGK